MKNAPKKTTRGYTILGLMIVVVILGILTTSTTAVAATPQDGAKEAGLVYSSGDPVSLWDFIVYARFDNNGSGENIRELVRKVIWNATRENVNINNITVVRVFKDPTTYGIWFTVIYRHNYK